MICICGKSFTGKNFGFIGPQGLIDCCSFRCRLDTKQKLKGRVNVTGSDAESGVVGSGKSKPPRKLSKSEIKKKLRPTERDVSRTIAKDLDGCGLWNTRTQSGIVKGHNGHVVRLCRTGTPDRIAAIGLHVWIEIKRSGEKPTPEQLDAIATLRANGALAFVVDDFEQWRKIRLCLLARVHVIDAINADIQRIQKEIDEALAR